MTTLGLVLGILALIALFIILMAVAANCGNDFFGWWCWWNVVECMGYVLQGIAALIVALLGGGDNS